jgi:ParB-like chromosome segregation protein Spo0J
VEGREMLKPEMLSMVCVYVPIKKKKTVNSDRVYAIAQSILKKGQQTPIAVRRDDQTFVLLDGLHRLETCRGLGEKTIQCVLVPAELA